MIPKQIKINRQHDQTCLSHGSCILYAIVEKYHKKLNTRKLNRYYSANICVDMKVMSGFCLKKFIWLEECLFRGRFPKVIQYFAQNFV